MMNLLPLYRMAKQGPWKTSGYGVQYRVEVTDSAAYLIFQYTASDSDWLFNFAWPPMPYRDQPIKWRCHWGFATLWKSARDTIMQEIFEATVFNPQRQIVIIGISQGAALATLAHEDMYFHGYDPVTYAFASPRVLWLPKKEIRARFDGLNVINRRGDIVTMLPPWLFGFRHVGHVKRIGRPAIPWWTYHTFEAYEKALVDG